MVDDLIHQLDGDRFLVQHVEGGPDLVYLRQNVRIFLSEINNLAVAEMILVTALLVGDAFRYGTPPVVLVLRIGADRRCLRIEVDDHRPFSPSSRPHGYRGGLLDRLASKRGAGPSGNGGTRTWVEIAATPDTAASRQAQARLAGGR